MEHTQRAGERVGGVEFVPAIADIESLRIHHLLLAKGVDEQRFVPPVLL